jgi:hypothetical protein
MITDIEKSFKAKLRNIAKETNRNPADLWQSDVLERFLIRLGQLPHRNHFVLKGGILLAKYIPIGRETQDLDLLGLNIANDTEQLKIKFIEIAHIDAGDGFAFRDVTVNELNHPHMAYAGIEVSMSAHFGHTRFPVAIDIGFGDTVKPIDKKIALTSYSKGPLFEEHVSLLCYPPEFIFAEKLETVVYRGGINSRMKDFHDLYTMLRIPEISHEALRKIIPSVFQHRETPFILPLRFTERDISSLQTHWASYLTRLRHADAKSLPANISDCIEILNMELSKIME